MAKIRGITFSHSIIFLFSAKFVKNLFRRDYSNLKFNYINCEIF